MIQRAGSMPARNLNARRQHPDALRQTLTVSKHYHNRQQHFPSLLCDLLNLLKREPGR
jgi:hypothetical protein